MSDAQVASDREYRKCFPRKKSEKSLITPEKDNYEGLGKPKTNVGPKCRLGKDTKISPL